MPTTSGIIGTYVIALWLERPHRLPVGRLGDIDFPPGLYLYAGSARGPGGLHARLARHRRRQAAGKRAHWHVDHLREHAAWAGAWGRASDRRLECEWAAGLSTLPGARIVARGFGSSDCRCPAHLLHVPALPGDAWFAAVLGAERIFLDDELDDLLAVLAAGDDAAREAAALSLGRFGPRAVEPLAAILARGDAAARWWSARALAETGGGEAVPPLLTALADADPDLRACAALALGRLAAASAAPALAARLADDSTFVAGIAADALSMLGRPAVPALAAMLAAESAHARLLAVRALDRIQAPAAVDPLCRALDDPSYLVRYYAQQALDNLGLGVVYFQP